MPTVIVNQGLIGVAVGFTPPDETGYFLKSYSATANDGRGVFEWTPHLEEARRFSTELEALHCWRAVPVNRPNREDGEPNRPLTAFNVLFQPVQS